ncbi:MAG TPA: hypothetical protein VMA73_17560 [Streptosporangiaceae bacterium]|nr:hypothetical protein [Streptosporangiaceae bacterium]
MQIMAQKPAETLPAADGVLTAEQCAAILTTLVQSIATGGSRDNGHASSEGVASGRAPDCLARGPVPAELIDYLLGGKSCLGICRVASGLM